jgi:hypothetical protein
MQKSMMPWRSRRPSFPWKARTDFVTPVDRTYRDEIRHRRQKPNFYLAYQPIFV